MDRLIGAVIKYADGVERGEEEAGVIVASAADIGDLHLTTILT